MASDPAAERNAGRIIARNTLFGVVSQVALRGVNFLFNVLVVRYLGGSSFGQYSVVLAWTAVFGVLGDIGITQYMTREIARQPDRAADLFWDTALLRFLLAIITCAVTIGGAVLKPYEPEIVLGVVLYTCTYFFLAIMAPLGGIILGHERIDVLSVLTVVAQVILIIANIIFLMAGFGFLSLFLGSLVTLPIMLIALLRIMRRLKLRPPPFRVTPNTWVSLIRAGVPFAFIQLSLTYVFEFDTLMLQTYFSNEIVGFYKAPYNLTRNLLIFTAAFSGAVGLTLTREHASNPEVIRPWYFRSVKLMVFLGLPLAVGGSLLAEPIIVALYGRDYAPSALPFAILIWDTPLLMYTAFCGQLLQAILREGQATRIYALEAVINIGLNLLMIPRYGLVAASFITVATEFTGVLLFYRVLRREVGAGLGFRHIIRFAPAVGAMGLVIWLLSHATPHMGVFRLLAVIAISGAVYVALVWITGALTAEERGLLVGFVRRRLSRFIPRLEAPLVK
jgi:O-antigen/teichoic acid export membrane protein